MSSIKAIVKKDLKDILRSRAVYFSLATAVFLFVMWAGDILKTLGGLTGGGTSAPQAGAALEAAVNSIGVMFAFTLTVFFGMYVNGYAVIMEKMKRSLESLLCTPVGLLGIWWGKTLAVFLPSTVLGLGITFLGLLGLNMAVIGPEVGVYVMPAGAPLLAALLGVPAVAFPLMFLLIGVQLVLGNVRWVNIVFLVLIFTVGYGLSRSLELGAGSWGFVGILFGVAALLGGLSLLLTRFITPERVVLSSRG